MGELLEKTLGFIGGLIIGVMAALISIASGHSKIISSDYKCTQTSIVGKSPNREEICVQYSHKEHQNDNQ